MALKSREFTEQNEFKKINLKVCDNKECEMYNKYSMFRCDSIEFRECKEKIVKVIKI